MSPLVVAPQMANPPASAQKVRRRAARRSATTARRAAPAAGVPQPDRGQTHGLDGLDGLDGAVGLHPPVGGMVVQEPQDQRDHGERGAGDHQGGDAPAPGVGDHGDDRQEDQLAHGAAGGQQPHHQPAATHEPPGRDGRRQHERHRPRAQADEHAPERHELPARGHEHGQAAARGDERQRRGDDPPDPEPLHESCRERRRQAEQHEVETDGGGQLTPRPAELLLERHHEDAGRGPERGRSEQGDERDRRDEQGGVQGAARPAHAPSGRRGRHVSSGARLAPPGRRA